MGGGGEEIGWQSWLNLTSPSPSLRSENERRGKGSMRPVRQGGEQVGWSEDGQVEIGGVAYAHPHTYPGVWLERK
jgi:hypothetical protein